MAPLLQDVLTVVSDALDGSGTNINLETDDVFGKAMLAALVLNHDECLVPLTFQFRPVFHGSGLTLHVNCPLTSDEWACPAEVGGVVTIDKLSIDAEQAERLSWHVLYGFRSWAWEGVTEDVRYHLGEPTTNPNGYTFPVSLRVAGQPPFRCKFFVGKLLPYPSWSLVFATLAREYVIAEDDNADEYMLSRAQWRALRRQAERLRATLGDGRLRLIDWLARKEWLP